MAEKRKHSGDVSKFFSRKKIKDENGVEKMVVICSLCEEGRYLKCDTKFNLARHISSVHKQQAKECGLLEQEENSSLGDVPGKPAKVFIHMDRNEYITNIVKWITECGLPLNFFSKACVHKVLHPVENALNLPHIDRKNVIRHLDVVDSKICEFISAEIKGRMVCIKADLATRRGRSVLGVIAQIVKNGVIHTRTIGMVERFGRNTAENIRDEILKILDKFHINLCQVYTITTDNGSNFIKGTELLKNAQNLHLSEQEFGMASDEGETHYEESANKDDEETLESSFAVW